MSAVNIADKVAQLQADVAQVNSGAQFALDRHLEKIALGTETLGSPAKDFVFLKTHELNPAIVAKYEAEHAALQGKVGQQVLVVADYKYQAMFSSHPRDVGGRDEWGRVGHRYSLGVATGEPIYDLRERSITLPTEKTAMLEIGDTHTIPNEWKITQDPLFVEAPLRFIGLRDFTGNRRVFAGTADVEKFFETADAGKKMLSYVEALENLGLLVPDQFAQPYHERLDANRLTVMHELFGIYSCGKKPDNAPLLGQKAQKLGLYAMTTALEIMPAVKIVPADYLAHYLPKKDETKK